MITAVMIVALACLRGWQDWLKLKSRELDLHRPENPKAGPATARPGSKWRT